LRKIRVGDYRLIYRIDSQDDEKVVRLLISNLAFASRSR
jgi:mRNA-degrading endonuclease RelE of RelBE toxin-antitoxin system